MEIGEKIRRIEAALEDLNGHEEDCHLCPRECGVNRRRGEKGYCQAGKLAAISHALLHHGEEPVLSGSSDCSLETTAKRDRGRGSGTLFFTGCNLKCCFCQNYQLSWLDLGNKVSDEELAAMMLGLQTKNALNINFVSPTHLLLPILRALRIAYQRGLRIPIVWNSNGFEKAEIIRKLEGIVDIYLPDFKYFSAEPAEKYSSAPDYFLWASEAIREMHRQKPDLIVNGAGAADEGLIVRHLVLPGWVKNSKAVVEWLAENLSPRPCLSLMSQFYPCFRAPEELQRTLLPEEYREVLDRAIELGFEEMFVQPEVFTPEAHLLPDFRLAEPFRWGTNMDES